MIGTGNARREARRPASVERSGASRTRRVLTGSVALVAALTLGAGPAAATPSPTPPSAQDVQDAKGAVQQAARSVADMEVRLAQLSMVKDDADVKVEQAGEAYTQALADSDAAQARADDAKAKAKAAAASAEQTRRTLVAMARSMARSGASTDLVESVLSADGFADVARRTANLDQVTSKVDETVQEYRAAQVVSTTLAKRAQRDAEAAKAARDKAQVALTTAQQTQTDAQAQVAAADTERDQLITQLAAAQQTSVDLERQRQDYLDQQRRDQQEAQAKAAALAQAAAQQAAAQKAAAAAAAAQAAQQAAQNQQNPSKGGSTGSGTTGSSSGSSSGSSGSGGSTGSGSTGSTGGSTGSSGSSSGGTTTTPPPTTPAAGLGTGTSRGSAASGAAAVAAAKQYLGAAYVWGATGPTTFDCSGLTMTAWRQAGVNLNRTSRDQYKQVKKITYDDLRPGDLVFWSTDATNADAIYHVAMWIGNGQIIEAPKPGDVVRITAMRWSGTMPYAGRP